MDTATNSASSLSNIFEGLEYKRTDRRKTTAESSGSRGTSLISPLKARIAGRPVLLLEIFRQVF